VVAATVGAAMVAANIIISVNTYHPPSSPIRRMVGILSTMTVSVTVAFSRKSNDDHFSCKFSFCFSTFFTVTHTQIPYVTKKFVCSRTDDIKISFSNSSGGRLAHLSVVFFCVLPGKFVILIVLDGFAWRKSLLSCFFRGNGDNILRFS
jgi:cytochrome bd-type quinol oxidase subunit 2